MALRIVHISDTHGARGHSKLTIPECDLLIFSGDLGGRTSPMEVVEFLLWFEKLPARKRIFIPGNHDICLDKKFVESRTEPLSRIVLSDYYTKALEIIKQYPKVEMLNDSGCEFEGLKIWGSPYTPSFNREYWAFNADRGEEIQKVWNKIPKDTDILITHGPPFGILDKVEIKERTAWHENGHVGCKNLQETIKSRLNTLKIHCFGHIHDNYGVALEKVSNSRRVLFSNGAVLNNKYEVIIREPLVITL